MVSTCKEGVNQTSSMTFRNLMDSGDNRRRPRPPDGPPCSASLLARLSEVGHLPVHQLTRDTALVSKCSPACQLCSPRVTVTLLHHKLVPFSISCQPATGEAAGRRSRAFSTAAERNIPLWCKQPPSHGHATSACRPHTIGAGCGIALACGQPADEEAAQHKRGGCSKTTNTLDCGGRACRQSATRVQHGEPGSGLEGFELPLLGQATRF